MSLLRSARSARPAFLHLRRPNSLSSTNCRAFHLSSTTHRISSKHWLWAAGLLLTVPLVFGRTVHLDAALATEQPQKGVEESSDHIIDPATGIEFPKTIRVASKVTLPLLYLVGVGVRTVSFLGIKVYSVAFYADLNNPNLKLEPTMTPEEKIQEIVKTCACEIRIVPTRSTSYTHLRDAFMRALNARLSDGRKLGSISEEQAQEVASPMRKLKTLFPNTPLAKHTPLDIFLFPPTPGKPRALIFRDLGAIEDDWVATEFVLHYFEGQGLSPPLKKMVVDRVETLSK